MSAYWKVSDNWWIILDCESINVFVYKQSSSQPTTHSDSDLTEASTVDTGVERDWVLLHSQSLPLQIVCTQIQETPAQWHFQVTVQNPNNEDSPLLDCVIAKPGSSLERTSSTFIEWNEKGSVWGLGFGNEKDALRFLSCCTPPHFAPSRHHHTPLQPAHSSGSSGNSSSKKQVSDRPKSVSTMDQFSVTGNTSASHMSHRPYIVPVQKPLSRPITDVISGKRHGSGMSPTGLHTQPSTPLKATRTANKDAQQVHIMPSGHSYTTAIRSPEESQYSSITVVPGASQVKRTLMTRGGARVNMQLLDQDVIRKGHIPDEKLLAALSLSHANRSDLSMPTSIFPNKYSPQPQHKVVVNQQILPAPIPPRKSLHQQGFYENTGDALYSEIFTVHQRPEAVTRPQTDTATLVANSSESSPTDSESTPEFHDLMTQNSQGPDNCQNFGGIPTLMETDLEEIGEADSPSDDDFEFQRTLFFPTTRRCRLSQQDMGEFDPLSPKNEAKSDESKLKVETNLSASVTLEDLSIKADHRNSILSQTDSGFDGNCTGSATSEQSVRNSGQLESATLCGQHAPVTVTSSSPDHLPDPCEYINVQWPRNSNQTSGSPNVPGGCPDIRKHSLDQGSMGGGIGPGVNEEEKLRNFVEPSCDLPTDDTQSEVSEDNFSIPSNNTSDNVPSPLTREVKSESSVTSQQYHGITRKAGWLEIKHILLLRKKRLEAAPKRKWHKYWCCLRGVSLLFYSVTQGEQPAIEESTEPACTLNVENCIGQAIPEHPKKENIFSLSTANGDVYLLEASSQIELENWITAIHSSCSSAFAASVLERFGTAQRSNVVQQQQQKPQDTLSTLKEEIRKREEAMDRDSKMRKMAQLQLSVTVDSKNRQPILAQIENWEQNLELMQCDLYRLRCYCASIQGSELPNPKGLLAAVSKDTKTHLAKLNCFNVSSIHALLSARTREVVDIAASSSLERSKKKPSMLSVLRPKEDLSGSSFQRNMKRRSWRQKDPDEPIKSAPGEGSCAFPFDFPNNQFQSMAGMENNLFGRLIKVSLPHNQKTVIPIKPGVTVHELLIHCCKKRKLDPRDHFIRIKTISAVVNNLTGNNTAQSSGSGENNSLGLKWVIPPYKAKMDDLDCRDVQLCIKEYHSMQLIRQPNERFGIEYETMQECAANDLRLYVVDVIQNSIAQLGGLVPGDELIKVNSQSVATVEPAMLDMILKTDQLNLVVRSMRPSTAPCFQCSNVTSDGQHLRISHSDHEHAKRRSQISEANSDVLSSNGSSSGCGSGSGGGGGIQENMTSSSETYKLACTLQELLNSEERYIQDLDTLLEKYLEPLANTTLLHSNELLVLAKNTRDILAFQQEFFGRIRMVFSSHDLFGFPEISSFQSLLIELCEVFSTCADGFKMYSPFCANHSKAQKVFESSRTMPEFLFFLERTNPENEHSKSLESYLIKPIQRILKYPLLLREIKVFIPDGSPDHNALNVALNHMESVAELINDMKRIHEEYGSIFDDLLSDQRVDMNCDIPMDELQMYGSAIWLNCPEEVIPKKIRIGNGEIEVIIFVFKRAIVLVGYNREKNRGKKRSIPSKESKFEEAVSNVQFLVPVSAVDVHGSVNREQDRLFLWDLVVHRGSQTQVLRMASRSLSTKESFLRAIRTSIREHQRLTANKSRRAISRMSDQGPVPRSLSQCNYVTNSIQPYNNAVFNTDCDTPVRRSQSPSAAAPLQPTKPPRHQSSISPDRFANMRIKPPSGANNPPQLQTQLSSSSNHESFGMFPYDVSPMSGNSSSSQMSWASQQMAMGGFSMGGEHKGHQADSGIFSDDNEHSMNTKLATTLEMLNPRH